MGLGYTAVVASYLLELLFGGVRRESVDRCCDWILWMDGVSSGINESEGTEMLRPCCADFVDGTDELVCFR